LAGGKLSSPKYHYPPAAGLCTPSCYTSLDMHLACHRAIPEAKLGV